MNIPATASARRSLYDHGIAYLVGDPQSISLILVNALESRRDWNARSLHSGAGAGLIAHQAYAFGARPDKLDVASFGDLGEVSVLGQKPVARVDRIDVCDLGCRDHHRDVEIAFCRRGGAYAPGLVGESHVQRVAVGFRVDRDRSNPKLPARPYDTGGDLATVGY